MVCVYYTEAFAVPRRIELMSKMGGAKFPTVGGVTNSKF